MYVMTVDYVKNVEIVRQIMNPTYRTVRKRLRAIRKAKGLTIAEASRVARISAVTLGSWERGDRKPTLENLIHLCNRYEISIESLVKEEEPTHLLMRIYHTQLTQGRA
jgi:transcriptional regulator with XRE-family HTH domain